MTSAFNKKDQDLLIQAINDQGFILENRTFNLLSKNFPRANLLQKGKVFSCEGERGEIDIVLEIGKWCFIIECKKSMFGWFFLSPQDQAQKLHLIWDSSRDPKKLETRALPLNELCQSYNWSFSISDYCCEFAMDGGLLVKEKYTKGPKKDLEKLQSSSRPDYMHDKVRQVLKSTQYYIFEKMGFHTKTPKRESTEGFRFLPILVTNAPLFHNIYDEKNITDTGDLTSFSKINPIDYIGYNFSEIHHWGENNNSRIESEDGSHTKTVFCVQIQNLVKFIKMLTLT